MIAKRIQRTLEKNRNEARGLLLRQYPSFIRSERADDTGGIPVFVFHAVTIELLEELFQFLSENGYATLTGDEYFACQTQHSPGQPHAVLLTFDDGHKTLYTVAYPVLKRFGFKAVAYVVPGMIPERSVPAPPGALEDSLCNWEDIREMHDSGVVDVQSHSMYHHSIATSVRVVDFVRPTRAFSFLNSDLAPFVEEAGVLPPGMPIHDWGARYGAVPAVLESHSVLHACIQYAASQGGAAFFRQRDWRAHLDSVLVEARRDNPPRRESAEEQRDAILQDLRKSKQELEKRLPGKVVRHFCYPWFRGSPLAVSLSVEAGYVSNAWGSLLPPFVQPGQLPLPMPRYAPDYIWRLPGRGGRSLRTILQQRFLDHGKAAKKAGMEQEIVSDSLPAILGQTYFAKPMHALFRAYDLAAYRKVRLDIRQPMLDLGCGNGSFGSVFCRVRGLKGFDIGLDFNPGNIRLARRRGSHQLVLRADARTLPLETGTINFVMANGVLCCIQPGHETVLAEIERVLAPGGQFVMTTPTPSFTDILFPTRLFRRLNLTGLAEFYIEKANKRHGHRTVEAYEGWEQAFERVGLTIEDHIYYFAGNEAIWWSVLAMRPFQAFAALRYGPAVIQRLATAFTETLVRSVRETGNPEEQEHGYLLILARKV